MNRATSRLPSSLACAVLTVLLTLAGSEAWAADPVQARHILRPSGPTVHGMVLSGDGQLLATLGVALVEIWELKTGRLRATLPHTTDNPHGTVGNIEAAVFSSDSRYLATLDDWSIVRLWNLASGKALTPPVFVQPLTMAFLDKSRLVTVDTQGSVMVQDATSKAAPRRFELQQKLSRALFSPRGQYLAAVAQPSGALSVWEVASGKRVLARTDEVGPEALAFSNDGRQLAVFSGNYRDGDFATEVWDVATGKRRVHYPSPFVRAFAFSPKGETLALAGEAPELRQTKTGKLLGKLAHPGASLAVAFSPDGRRLVSGGTDHTAQVWQLDSKKAVATLLHDNRVLAAAFSSKGDHLVTMSLDGRVRIWDAQLRADSAARGPTVEKVAPTPAERDAGLVHLLEHGGSVMGLAFSPDGRTLATAAFEGRVRLWSTDDASEQARLEFSAFHEPLLQVRISPDSKHIAASEATTPGVHVWEAETGCRVLNVQLRYGPASELAFTRDGKRLLISGSEVRDLDLTIGDLLPIWEPGIEARGAVVSPDGKQIATRPEADSPTVLLRELGTGKELLRLKHAHEVSSLAFSPDGARLATAERNGAVRVWDVSSGRELRSLGNPGPVQLLVFSPDGKRLAIASATPAEHLWATLPKREGLPSGREGTTVTLHLGPEGKPPPPGSVVPTVRVWAVDSGLEQLRLSQDNVFTSLVFSPDGRMLATADNAYQSLLVNVETGQKLAHFPHPERIDALAFSPDGALLATGCTDRFVRLWKVGSASGKEKAASAPSSFMRQSQEHCTGEPRQFKP